MSCAAQEHLTRCTEDVALSDKETGAGMYVSIIWVKKNDGTGLPSSHTF